VSEKNNMTPEVQLTTFLGCYEVNIHFKKWIRPAIFPAAACYMAKLDKNVNCFAEIRKPDIWI
jgi:hypothetical protein